MYFRNDSERDKGRLMIINVGRGILECIVMVGWNKCSVCLMGRKGNDLFLLCLGWLRWKGLGLCFMIKMRKCFVM